MLGQCCTIPWYAGPTLSNVSPLLCLTLSCSSSNNSSSSIPPLLPTPYQLITGRSSGSLVAHMRAWLSPQPTNHNIQNRRCQNQEVFLVETNDNDKQHSFHLLFNPFPAELSIIQPFKPSRCIKASFCISGVYKLFSQI